MGADHGGQKDEFADRHKFVECSGWNSNWYIFSNSSFREFKMIYLAMIAGALFALILGCIIYL